MLVAMSAAATESSASDLERRAQASRELIKEFAGALKRELKGALAEGGPLRAITACSAVAPAIAQQYSSQKGWRIGRTSLKPRNPANAPDRWERSVLESFERRRTAGEDPARMEFFEMVEQDGKRVFRYMKAVPTAEKPCLACHGSNIRPEVAAALDERYPEDKARGFRAGEIRGAFTITQPLPR